MEAGCISETLASTYETTRGQKPQQHQHLFNRREKLKKFHNYISLSKNSDF
jgi:hypothetical protein